MRPKWLRLKLVSVAKHEVPRSNFNSLLDGMLVSLRATPGSKSLLPILYKQLKKGRVRYSCLRVHYHGLLLIRAITSGLQGVHWQ